MLMLMLMLMVPGLWLRPATNILICGSCSVPRRMHLYVTDFITMAKELREIFELKKVPFKEQRETGTAIHHTKYSSRICDVA